MLLGHNVKNNIPKVDILLAACNGEKFLKQQIDSILNQTYPNIRLIIRDDASSDATPTIIQSYIEKYPQRIIFIQENERQGVKCNFSKLMEYSTAPYIMFSDQDDVWMPQKVQVTLDQMENLEHKHGFHPYLVHSDLVVVDKDLKILNPSFWRYANLNPHQAVTINRLLNQNVVTGCTVMINHLLLEIARPIPEEAFMHDWWMALAAAAFGKISFIQEPTMYYRQHGSNALGAQKFGSIKNLKANFQKLMNKNVRKFQQATSFYHRYYELFDQEQRAVLKTFLDLQRGSWLEKRKMIVKHGFYKQGFLRNVADFLFG